MEHLDSCYRNAVSHHASILLITFLKRSLLKGVVCLDRMVQGQDFIFCHSTADLLM